MGKKMNFKNSDSLILVKKLLDEAELDLNDKNRTTADVGGELGRIMDKILKSEAFGIGAAGTGLAVGGIAGVGLLSAMWSVAGLGVAGITSRLASGVEDFWNKLLSDEKIEQLEVKYKLSYDISSNTSKISQQIIGLCPLYHRFQSLHDPIIGFIFGVVDLMKGQLTAIDGNGRLIIQSIKSAETKLFIEAIITVFGHFLSDVGTKSKTGKIFSVPVPLTPILQLIQTGSIEYKGQKFTVADLSKKCIMMDIILITLLEWVYQFF